jgi:GMP synthase-like glutamine amidotransferase
MREFKLWLLIAIGLGVAVGAGVDLIEHLECQPQEPSPVRVLILDNSLNRPIYQPGCQWKGLLKGVPADAVHMPSAEPVPSLDGYTHVIISGSTASLVDPPAWAQAEAALVQEAAHRGLAILGSCFGHQMLVYALSGPGHVQRAASPEVGWVAIEMSQEDPLFAGLPAPWHAFAWHEDEVVDPPPPWKVLGSSSTCGVHVIRHGNDPIWGLQSHPETTPCEAKSLLLLQKVFRDWDSEEIDAALRQTPQDDKIIGVILERFLAAGRPQG